MLESQFDKDAEPVERDKFDGTLFDSSLRATKKKLPVQVFSKKDIFFGLFVAIIFSLAPVWDAPWALQIFWVVIVLPFGFCGILDFQIALQYSKTYYGSKLPRDKPHVNLENGALPTIGIIIPCCNEPFDVVKMTLNSVTSLRYPFDRMSVVVIDNSDEDNAEYKQIERFVQELNTRENLKATFIHRVGREGFKPKNIDIGMSTLNTDYVLFLDVDSTIHEDTLHHTVHSLQSNSNLAFAQVRTLPTNTTSNSLLAKIQGITSNFQRHAQAICAEQGHALFYGHNALWRSDALEKIGSCLETYKGNVILAEDLSMSLRAVEKGYHGKAVWLKAGEWVPASLRETESMWLRWTEGTMQVICKYLSEGRRLENFTLGEKVGWFYHVFSYITAGLAPPLLAVALVSGFQPLLIVIALGITMPAMHVIITVWKVDIGTRSVGKKLLEAYLAFFVLGSFITWTRFKGLMQFLFNKKSWWKPTGKGNEEQSSFFDTVTSRADIILFSVSILAICVWKISQSNSLLDIGINSIVAILPINLILSVLVFGGSRMTNSGADIIEHSTIQQYKTLY